MIFKPIDKPRRVFIRKRKGVRSAYRRQQRRQERGANEVEEKWDHESGKQKIKYFKNDLFGKVKSRKNVFASDHRYFDEMWRYSIKQTEQEKSLWQIPLGPSSCQCCRTHGSAPSSSVLVFCFYVNICLFPPFYFTLYLWRNEIWHGYHTAP